ncbi:MAG TPA: hypothetical protein VE820_03865 [Sphingomicrobium sp.]|nr:hypothetical protein [Sphingomicrobium sp.]
MQFVSLLLAVAASQSPLAGLYQSQQMEVGAALELQKNGHFRYQLDYGAVSEEAEGDWTSDGKTVRLTSKPMPKLPSFELVRDDPAPKGDLTLTVEPPGFGAEGYRIDAVAVDAESGEKGMVTADSDGHVDTGGHKLSSIDPMVPVYGTVAGHFPLSADRGHHLVLRFHANDLGRAAFAGEPLAVTPRGLVLDRYETEIRFVRVRP